MAQTVSDRWLPALVASHYVADYVGVWNVATETLLGYLPITAGSVTDVWASGPRRTLSVTAIASNDVKQMIRPGVELRPYSGIDYRGGAPEVMPMGCFPVTDHVSSVAPGDTLSLNCSDRWTWVVLSDFIVPKATDTRLTIVQQVTQLLAETGQWDFSEIEVQFTSTVKVAAQTFDTNPGNRATACIELLKTIGAEIFIERDGHPVMRYRPTATAPAAVFVEGQRLKNMQLTESSADVYNVVVASSTSTDPAVPTLTYKARITDPMHPAYPRPGVPLRSTQLSGPQYITLAQLKNAAQKELSKVSRLARQISITPTAPDPSLDASDTVSATWPARSDLAGLVETPQIQQITHPLTLADSQTIQGVSSRSDEDFTP